ncbi:beta-lactamase/transpeptidase-like protein [Phaeosphaeria sp. MPI-PUGE-AT-0046c]|nr:beta-lactamase/transpeptidase-like protein [Phaeosphaeria sp. MPI-PUGE-AT-0046c]
MPHSMNSAMNDFEAYLDKSTAKGANVVPGAIMAAVDSAGQSKTAGYDGVAEDAQPVSFDQVAYIASRTKLITSIASLQIVEHPRLLAWRKSRGENAGVSGEGDVANDCAYPRAYEAGDSWAYSTGLDWASLLVSRLTNSSFEEYIQEHIAKPLGVTSFTWHLARKPAVAQKVMRMNTRQSDGIFVESRGPFGPAEPKSEGGGGGMYASVHDYTRVLSDLLKDEPVLLEKSSVDQLFTPQLAVGSDALAALATDKFAVKPALDNSLEGVSINHTLGGLLLVEDVQRENYFKPKDSVLFTKRFLFLSRKTNYAADLLHIDIAASSVLVCSALTYFPPHFVVYGPSLRRLVGGGSSSQSVNSYWFCG